tara:strand:+ start:306 stop:659 length:354 start_codon:yes stop_codon:yes gene_type:complete
MKKAILTIVAILISSICISQELSPLSFHIRKVNPEVYYEIELLVKQKYQKTDPFFNILVNAQVKSRKKTIEYMDALETDPEGLDKVKKLEKYIVLSIEEIKGVEVFDWIRLATFLGL